MTHWQASCLVNRLLLGDPTRPLCSRVFVQPNSAWRTVYLRATDWLFDEPHHCLRVHLRWLTLRYL